MTAVSEHDVYECDCGEYHCRLDPESTGCADGGYHCLDHECGPCQDEAVRERRAELAEDIRRSGL